jgi:hypothetical protein
LTIFFSKKKRKHWSGALWAIVPKEFRKKGKTLLREKFTII